MATFLFNEDMLWCTVFLAFLNFCQLLMILLGFLRVGISINLYHLIDHVSQLAHINLVRAILPLKSILLGRHQLVYLFLVDLPLFIAQPAVVHIIPVVVN